MNPNLLHDLVQCETDIDGALPRFCDNEALYLSCLSMFLEDQTMKELDEALRLHAWDDAFTAAHALKGLAGNMGFVPLFHSAAELVVLIRGGRITEIDASYAELKRCYQSILSTIRPYCGKEEREKSL